MTLASDVRLALRSLRRRPAFAALSVAILALGIGANSAIFSVVNAVLLNALPYGEPERLVVVFADGSARGQNSRLATSPGAFLDLREQSTVFSGFAAIRNQSLRLTSLETPLSPLVHAVTANYFDVLGARPLVGRGFTAGEDAPGRDRVVILSYGIWQSVYGGEAEVVGRTIDLDDQPYTVIGVMPPDFYSAHFIAVQPGLWVPAPLSAQREDRTTRDLLGYARLAEGQTLASAQAAMRTVAEGIARQHPATDDRWSVTLVPIREHAVGQFSRTGGLLLAAVGLVLLIACANVANLTLARASERSREIALRTALGASRSRIVAQLLTESLLLGLAGGGLGVLLAQLAAGPLARLIPAQAGVPFLDVVGVDARVLVFTLFVSLVSAVAFGLAPARQATRLDLVGVLREGGRGAVSAPGQRLRGALVVAEVALAVIVVSAAALMLRTTSGLARVSPGFDADRVLKLRTGVRGEEYRTPASRIAHFEELERRLAQVPGVSSVGVTSFEPPILAGGFGTVRIVLPGTPEDTAVAPSAVLRSVSAGYFATLGIPLLKGRGIAREDTADSRRVAVISESMARRHFPGVEPVGRSFALYGPGSEPLEVVGVVGDVLTAGTDPTPVPVFYLPYPQFPLAVMSAVMRVPSGDAAAPAREAERVAWTVSRSANVYGVETLDRRIADLNWQPRFSARLLGGFAALALLLGAAGVYAVISYSVLQRRAEIGVRIALGARAWDVVGLVAGGGLRLAGTGVVLGGLGSLAVTRALSGLLYGVSPGDPATLGAVAVLLLSVAGLACAGPALRASRIDPQVALRE